VSVLRPNGTRTRIPGAQPVGVPGGVAYVKTR
jgi:hypothetical protein